MTTLPIAVAAGGQVVERWIAARNANVFLENGARLYLDTGFHPEYATPECDDVAELVSHDKAGDRIVEALRSEALASREDP